MEQLHRENSESASVKLEVLRNKGITWNRKGFVEVLQSTPGIDSWVQARGLSLGFTEVLE